MLSSISINHPFLIIHLIINNAYNLSFKTQDEILSKYLRENSLLELKTEKFSILLIKYAVLYLQMFGGNKVIPPINTAIYYVFI